MRVSARSLPFLAAAAFLGPACGDGGGGAERPNVLVVTLDTLRRDSVGFHGRTPSPSPRLDALAAEAVVFDDAYTVAPLTLPAHTSLFTGLYPASHGVRDNDVMRVPGAANTLAEILSANGYRCFASVAAFVLDPAFGLDQGFETYLAPGRRTAGEVFEVPQIRADAVVDRGITALDELAAGEGPWMVWLHLYDPHAPYDPGDLGSLGAAGDRAAYEAEIRHADAQIGRFVDELERRGLWDDTVLVFASDHGEGLDDGPEPSHGYFVHDTTLRIPMFVRHPDLEPRRVAAPASLVDVMPTVLGLLGVPTDAREYDGRDLGPALRGEGAEDVPIQFECYKPWVDHGWAPYEGLLEGPWKVVRSHDSDLFDRADDPGEERDLIADESARADEMLAELDRRLGRQLDRMEGETVRLDPAAEDALAALGYASGGGALSSRPDFEALPDPADKFPLILRMHVLSVRTALGDDEGVVESLEELCELDPGSAVFAERLGLAMLRVPNPDVQVAEAHLRRAAQIRPERPRTHLGLSRCYGMQAMAARREAALLQSRGDDEGAREQQALWREHQRRRVAELRLVLRLESTNPQAMFNLAIALTEDGDFERARAQPALARALYEEAGELLDRMLAIVPDDDPRVLEAQGFRKTIADRIVSLGP